MSTDPYIWPSEATEAAPSQPRIPHIGHTLLFLAIAGASVLLVQLMAFGLAVSLHFFPHETNTQLMRDPRLLIPTMFLSYFVAGLLSIVIFSSIWRRPFADGVRWDTAPVARHLWLLIGIGVVVSIAVQLLSNFLPIPKELPMDDFFRTRLDIWIVAIFGVFIAPVFEELAFRGFLLPSLATSWDWVANKRSKKTDAPIVPFESNYAPPLLAMSPIEDPKWSTAAIVFASILTSICFALLHADQLAHAYAPLGVLFGVSLVLCAVRIRFHSMAASALVHACYNGTIFAMLFVATSGFRHLEKLSQ
jgi:membrane protease YdiL (CAAX protease family)